HLPQMPAEGADPALRLGRGVGLRLAGLAERGADRGPVAWPARAAERLVVATGANPGRRSTGHCDQCGESHLCTFMDRSSPVRNRGPQFHSMQVGIAQTLLVAGMIFVPTIGIGLKTLAARRWALWAGLGMSLVTLA